MFETTIEWHKASEELPKESCEVIAISNFGRLFDIDYSDKNKSFNSTDYDNGEYKNDNILYWAYKEEIILSLHAKK